MAASNYPGQNADADQVLIGNGNTVTLNVDITAYTLNNLVIGDNTGADDILLLPNNGDFEVNIQTLAVESDGILEWVKNADIRFPEGAIIYNNGGTISTSKNCNASQVIYIGNDKFSTCNGNGGADYSFDDIESALPPPTSDGDITECEETPIQTLTASATPPAGAYVDWYNASEGGAIVSPTLNTVGTVTYYAESVDSSDPNRKSIFRSPVTLTIEDSPTISISSAPACNFLTNTYALEVTVSNGTVTSSDGTVTNISGNQWRIANIPNGTDITATVTAANSCATDLAIAAPNCTCPAVNAPVSEGDQAYCTGDPVPALMVSVGAGETADWFDSASGGNLLQSGSTSYTPPGPGQYYTEARNTVTGCRSNSRTPIILTEDVPATATMGPDQTIWVSSDAVFSVAASNANTYQWQVSSDGGTSYTDLADDTIHQGTQTTVLTIKNAQIVRNGYRYRAVVSNSMSSCPPFITNPAILIVRVRSVITNRQPTYRVNPF
ncbi:immunoglobulin domain-containing protein [Muriicola soli]|uniref:immunoglobulin domain-containing protein n=1 Tax=Muriicola soli TaxID=2507538 RepID=UPI0013ED4CFA|nr:hypothetical protein [Muriicola soli]